MIRDEKGDSSGVFKATHAFIKHITLAHWKTLIMKIVSTREKFMVFL